MSVALRRQRDGSLRKFWYGEFRDADRKRKVLNLGEWRGTPPPALLGTGDETEGDQGFEDSRTEAEAVLKRHAEEARRKGRAVHLTERLIESKTGRAVEYVRIDELAERWKKLSRKKPLAKKYLVVCDAHFNRFVEFMQRQNREAVYIYEVTEADAHAYASECRKQLADATASDTLRLAAKSIARFLPIGAPNPFDKVDLTRTEGEMIHRRPFTPEELQSIIATANGDDFMSGLITAAACTGMRRGDVCNLQWSAVDLAGGMLAVKTGKTGAAVEIPIFDPLRSVLETRKGNRSKYVFPKAARMLADNPDGLSYRFKSIVARALDTEAPEAEPEVVPAAEIEAKAAAAIREHVPEGDRQDRMLDTLRRYCEGQSYREIEKATGRVRGSISYDLNKVGEWIGKRFVKAPQGDSVKKAIARVTRTAREGGQKAASVMDWHALRTTFVTLALSAGVPMELVRRVTGHSTVDIVLRHYFRPGREDFRAALVGALPEVLTGGKVKRLNPADELAALAGKIAAGTATKKDKTRLKKLAAKVK